MTNEAIENKQDSLNLQDLLVDEETDLLSDYIALSIENLGRDTKVSVTTIEDSPTTYSTILNGLTLTDLQYLVEESINNVHE